MYLIPAFADTWLESCKRPHIASQLVDATRTRGVAERDVFARVTYQRELLRPGVVIVARRTAVAENVEKVVSQIPLPHSRRRHSEWR